MTLTQYLIEILIVEWKRILQGDKRYDERKFWNNQYNFWFDGRDNTLPSDKNQRTILKT